MVARAVKNALLLVASAIVALAAAEVFSRAWFPPLADEAWDRAEVSEVGSSQIAGQTVEGLSNSLGLRGPEVPLASDRYRILALGDSFTYGFKLSNASSWPKLLEGILHDAGRPEIEVLNGGRPGTDTQWQLDYFRNLASRYRPDMVVIGFVINDCTELCSNCGVVKIKERLDAARRKREGRFSSRFLRRLEVALLERRLSTKTVERFRRAYTDESPGLAHCQAAFREIRALSEASRFALLVFIYPMLYKLESPYPFIGIHDQMLAFWQSLGIRAYDLTPAFYGRRDTDLWVQNDDSHPTREANLIAARAIADVITSLETGDGP